LTVGVNDRDERSRLLARPSGLHTTQQNDHVLHVDAEY
jgi:hypothetical protein